MVDFIDYIRGFEMNRWLSEKVTNVKNRVIALVTENLVLIAVAVIVIVLFAVGFWTLRSDSGVVELTKVEALTLMDLQTKAVMIVADRDQYVQQLYAKYQMDPKTHQLNLAAGQFVPVPPPKEKVNETTPATQ